MDWSVSTRGFKCFTFHPRCAGQEGLSLHPCVGLKVEDPDLDVIERAVHRLSAEKVSM